MLRIGSAIVLCLFSGSALSVTLKGSVTSPEAGVICDKKAGFCADSEGISVALTKMYLGEKAEKKLMSQIGEIGKDSFDPTTFVLTDGVACNTKAKKCTVSKISGKVDAKHTKALFGAAPTAPAAAVPVAGGFDKTLELQGITFHVKCANAGSMNKLRIEPKGLKGDNKPMEKEIEGTVTMAEVADLNVDGSPEVYVYVTSAGSGSYGSLVAYAANKKKSLSEIFLPALTDDAAASKGYLGHDEFRVVESSLVRRFPVYREGDTNAKPTGGTRQISYKLKAGEAGWVLRPEKPVSY
jgi:hypothetical protein